jgi:hypothetical protein
MAEQNVKINRAPVLTLWAAVVAERLGYDRDEALTLGKAVAGLNAQSKGRRLGIFEEPAEPEKKPEPSARAPGKPFRAQLLGRAVPAVQTEQGLRAVVSKQPVDPRSVQRYLEKKFGDRLGDVRAAMEELAGAYEADRLARRAYALYEAFRPSVPEGKKGWGARGDLDLGKIRSLAG